MLIGAMTFTACGNGDEAGTAEETSACAKASPAAVAEKLDTLNINMVISSSVMPPTSGKISLR